MAPAARQRSLAPRLEIAYLEVFLAAHLYNYVSSVHLFLYRDDAFVQGNTAGVQPLLTQAEVQHAGSY